MAETLQADRPPTPVVPTRNPPCVHRYGQDLPNATRKKVDHAPSRSFLHAGGVDVTNAEVFQRREPEIICPNSQRFCRANSDLTALRRGKILCRS
ncbi:hypothetical protein QE435_002459 [Rhizobium sp. SORGH_AS 787]|nr:hypothetical protein [Rhizobium sp. SORGH_AS_0787]